MKAIVVESYGEDSVFLETQVSIEPPGANHIQLSVAATSVNPIDSKVRLGQVPAISAPTPAILHGDFAGVVSHVGSGVEGFTVGDRVYGCGGGFKGAQGGALAEQINVPAAAVAMAPQSLQLAHAAALPLVAITAWQALFEKAQLQPGQKVLIHGGCGGVGHVALQLAKIAGAEVTTTVSSDAKAAIAKRLGAHHVVNYRHQEVADYLARLTHGAGFDVVVDTVGGTNMDRSFQAVCCQGNVVTIAARSSHDLTPMHGKGASLHMLFMLTPLLTGRKLSGYQSVLEKIAGFVDQGRIVPLIDAREFHMSADGVTRAHDLLASGKAVGKIVIKGFN